MKKLLYSFLSVLIAFSSLLLMPISPAYAAADTCTWTGTNSGNWSDGGNWTGCDNGGVPEDGDSLVFPAGAANLTNANDIAGTLDIDSITISGDNYVLSGNPVYVSGVFHFVGNNNSAGFGALAFTNPSTGTSLVIDGTGNTIPTSLISLNMTGGDDFNVYANQDFSLSEVSGVTGNFNKWGTATLTTSTSASGFGASGAVNILGGTFVCRNANCAGGSANDIQTQSTGSLVLDGASIIQINHDIILGSSASPQLNMLPGDVTINGDIYVNTTGTIYAQTGTLTLNGNVLLDGNDLYMLTTSTTNATIEQDNGSVISDSGSNRSLNVIGGRVVLNGNNNYPGVTNVTGNSVLQISHDNSLGGTAGGTVVENGSVLGATTSLTSAEPLQLEGAGVAGIFTGNYEGALINDGWDPTFTGDIVLTSNTTIKSTDGGITFSGAISGVGDLTFRGRVGGQTNIGGGTSNTYVGNTYIDSIRIFLAKTAGNAINGNVEILGTEHAGYLVASSNGGNQIADDATVSLVNGAFGTTFESYDTETIGTVTGNGHLESDGPGFGFTIGGGNLSGTFSGTVDNEEGTITKIGTGTWTLAGVTQPNAGNTFDFVVNGGNIVWNSVVTDTQITVNTGATLKGNGSLGNTTINTGGTINTGNSPGCMTVADLTLTAGSNFDQEIASPTACSGYDQTTSTGPVDLGGATLNVINTYTPASGTVFTIISAPSVTGTFAGLADNTEFDTPTGIRYRINYNNPAGTVTLTYISGTLAPTGQSSNQIALIALVMFTLATAGLALERASRQKRNA